MSPAEPDVPRGHLTDLDLRVRAFLDGAIDAAFAAPARADGLKRPDREAAKLRAALDAAPTAPTAPTKPDAPLLDAVRTRMAAVEAALADWRQGLDPRAVCARIDIAAFSPLATVKTLPAVPAAAESRGDGCVVTASCGEDDHTYTWPCDLAPGTGIAATGGVEP